ncbi:beta-barrel assembly-enhancing protease [Aliikangiella sp. IMCC44632]
MYRLLIVSLVALLAYSSANFAVELPNMGSSSSKVFGLAEEQAVGDDYMRQLRAFAPIMHDAEVNDYIQDLGFKLVEQNINAQDRQFSFFVIRNKALNAFALPGGYIGVHSGLIVQSDTESELASVLGHEVAHVTQRHLARRLELQSQLAIPTLAAFAAAILIGVASDNADIGQAGLIGGQSMAQQAMINHTRSNEAEADRIGIESLYQAGFDPMGAITFFEKMQAKTQYYAAIPEFLRTHPLSRSRITDARLRARQYPSRSVESSPRYWLIKEKINAITMSLTPETLNSARVNFESGKLKLPAQQYGYAILLTRAKKFDQANSILSELAKNDPKQASYAIALAQLNLQTETPHKSIPTIKSLLSHTPTSHALVETLAQLYMANDEHDKARKLLLENIHMASNAPHLLKHLSEAQLGSGHHSEVYETEGNYLLAMGDLGGARIQFEQALNIHTNDPYARARINAQINKIREYLRQRSLRR